MTAAATTQKPATTTQSENQRWQPDVMWPAPSVEPTQLGQDDFAKWKLATAAVRRIAMRDNLSKSEVARRSDVAMGTFSPWYDGKYPGSMPAITERVQRWIDAV